MIPVTDNELKPQMNERDKKVVREIEDFMASGSYQNRQQK